METCRYDTDTATKVALLHKVCLVQQANYENDLEMMKRVNAKKREKGQTREFSKHDLNRNRKLDKELIEWQKKPAIVAALRVVKKKLDAISSEELVFSKSDEVIY